MADDRDRPIRRAGARAGGRPATRRAGPGRTSAGHPAQRTVLREATRQFRSVDRAVAAGYRPTHECVPGMGYHYGHPALAGGATSDPTLPEILVYAPPDDGALRLVALEYFRRAK